MIGGVLVDALVLAAVLAFAWGGVQLGGRSVLGRLVEASVAILVAGIVRDPVGGLVEWLLGTSTDFSRLIGMVVVGSGSWFATHKLFQWWCARRDARRFGLGDEDVDVLDIDLVPDDRLDSVWTARIAGGAIGLGWSVLFVAMLVLQPSSTPISRSAIESRTGGALIANQWLLQWIRDGFPHYAQTLPKGSLGAVVGERASIPMRLPVRSGSRAVDADRLLRSTNALRRTANVPVLTFNPEIAGVARRHAAALADARALSYRSPGGGALDQRVLASVGEAVGSFEDEIGIEVLWAHDPATAMQGLLSSSRSQSLLKEGRWSEIGIGVADAGWFNGRVYVLLLVAAVVDGDGDGDGESAIDSEQVL